MNAEDTRDAFERWISSSPIYAEISRWAADSAWPGQYQDYNTQLAWEAWCEAFKVTKRKPKPSSVTLLDRKMELEAYVLNHLDEVHNLYGGVTGYRLNLDPAQTEKLIKLIEAI